MIVFFGLFYVILLYISLYVLRFTVLVKIVCVCIFIFKNELEPGHCLQQFLLNTWLCFSELIFSFLSGTVIDKIKQSIGGNDKPGQWELLPLKKTLFSNEYMYCSANGKTKSN